MHTYAIGKPFSDFCEGCTNVTFPSESIDPKSKNWDFTNCTDDDEMWENMEKNNSFEYTWDKNTDAQLNIQQESNNSLINSIESQSEFQ